jgi:D-beta-D-heptose 7-phosphate kinase/D-beta-D-heptose 1-phosphate adenosyltransferase
LQAEHPRVLLIDSKSLRAYRNVGATVVKPNFAQLEGLLGSEQLANASNRVDAVLAQRRRIFTATGAEFAAVTLDSEGAVIMERGGPSYRTYAKYNRRAQCSGAGDTFAAAMTLALAASGDAPAAAEIASAAAAIVVGKEGTSTCNREELGQYLFAGHRSDLALPELLARVAEHRARGARIVLTNGCFDILHRGHVMYLNQAKALGDVLIVGVNSDESIRRLKGPDRPINSADDRVSVLAGLSCIDHIIVFRQDTPIQLIEAVRPDTFVKGGDYTRETLPEASVVESLGGEVRILPLVQDRSTTCIINRICQVYVPNGNGRRLVQGVS